MQRALLAQVGGGLDWPQLWILLILAVASLAIAIYLCLRFLSGSGGPRIGE